MENTRAETKLFSPGSLPLFNLSDFKLQFFWRIVANGGFFISRLKDAANPTITAVNTTHRGRAIDVMATSSKKSWAR